MATVKDKLNELSRGHKSEWSGEAAERLNNHKWLRYSSNVARRALAALENAEGVNQKVLADQIGVSSQYISKLLKGRENLTLETIAKLSEALGTELISFPEYKYSVSVTAKKHFVPDSTGFTCGLSIVRKEFPAKDQQYEASKFANTQYAMAG